MLLEDVGSSADQALLEIAVRFQHLAREDERDGLGHVVGEERVGRLEMDAERVRVGRLHALDFLEREGLHALLRVGLEAVLDVGRGELAPVERRHVVPLHAWPELERPHAIRRIALPGFGEVTLQAEVAGVAGLIRIHVADQTVADESRELVEPDGLREPRIDQRRVPRRGARDRTAGLRRLRAGIQSG